MLFLGITVLTAIALFTLILCVLSAGFRTFIAEVLWAIRDYIEIGYLELRLALGATAPGLGAALGTARAGLGRVGARVKLVAVTLIVAGILGPIVLAGFLLKGSTESYMSLALVALVIFLLANAIRQSSLMLFAADYIRRKGWSSTPVGTPLTTAKSAGLSAIAALYLAVVALCGQLTQGSKHIMLLWALFGIAIWIVGKLMRRDTLAPQIILTTLIGITVMCYSAPIALAKYAPAKYRQMAAWLDLQDTEDNIAAAQAEDEAKKAYIKIFPSPTQIWTGTPNTTNNTLQGTKVTVTVDDKGVKKSVPKTFPVGAVLLLRDPKMQQKYILVDSNNNPTPITVIEVYELDGQGEPLDQSVFISLSKIQSVKKDAALATFTPKPAAPAATTNQTTAPAAAQTAVQAPAVQQPPQQVTPTASKVTSKGNIHTIVLMAKDKWFNTGINLTGRYKISVDRNSRWSNGGAQPQMFDANGFSGLKMAGTIAPDQNLGQLLIKVGGQNVGPGTNAAPGLMLVTMNDMEDEFSDNQGYVVITVEVLP